MARRSAADAAPMPPAQAETAASSAMNWRRVGMGPGTGFASLDTIPFGYFALRSTISPQIRA
jgi:hypothetical protein